MAVTVPRSEIRTSELVSGVAERRAAGARFAGLFASVHESRARLIAALAWPRRFETLEVTLARGEHEYPALTPSVAAAGWYEREIHDLFGLIPLGHPRLDPLVVPLADGDGSRPRPGTPTWLAAFEREAQALPAHLVGEGVFTIPYGPVRSGVFESVEYLIETPGEDIPHLRTRVFHKHRGIERTFDGLTPERGVLVAERVEGVATVAHALAFCEAVERIADVHVPLAARLVRSLYAELERVANHLDVAVRLTEAAGLAVAHARFGLHKERVLRLVSRLCGSRFGRGVVVPGGVRAVPLLTPVEILHEVNQLEGRIRTDALALLDTPSFLDRVRDTGPIPPDIAHDFGALGPVGRASGVIEDARLARPYAAYEHLGLDSPAWYDHGDALTRLQVRWDEVWGAFHLVRQAVDELGAADHDSLVVPIPPGDGAGLGWAEAPQGEVLYLVELRGGRLARVKPRSASFHNLALFPLAFRGDIFTDFAFIEATFGLSIAGVTL
jgi:formate hydrogenlyase subunit 5